MKVLDQEINEYDVVLLEKELGGIKQTYLGIIKFDKIPIPEKIFGKSIILEIYNSSIEEEYFSIKEIKNLKIIKKFVEGEN